MSRGRVPFAVPFAWRCLVRLAWSSRGPAASSQTTPLLNPEADS